MFEAIARGDKRYEVRSPDARYRDIAVNDILLLSCGSKTVQKRVVAIFTFPTIAALVRHLGLNVVYPPAATLQEVEERFLAFPNYRERIARDGLKALELGYIDEPGVT